MSTTATRVASERPRASRNGAPRVAPSGVDPTAAPFSFDQELSTFGRWVGEPIWAPPTGEAKALAETMHRRTGWFASREERWQAVVDEHRDRFTQVRQIELPKASIRLPEGRFFVSVTEQKDFDKIEEKVPACVQTRLEEFLAGPGQRRGVKVYYLKPLCVEVCDDLVLTTRADLERAIERVQQEAFAEHREMAPLWRLRDGAFAAANLALAPPRAALGYFADRRRRAVARYQARLEFKRRKTALGAMRNHHKCRTHGCTFDEMLALTTPLREADCAAQYSLERLEVRKRRERVFRLLVGKAAGVSSPWMATLALVSALAAPSIVVCDPVFVAEMPEAPGELLKIGHFDEVGGVLHVEI